MLLRLRLLCVFVVELAKRLARYVPTKTVPTVVSSHPVVAVLPAKLDCMLLGLVSLISPHKIKRDPVSCIDCGKCARVCPSSIKVDRVKTVVSDECTTCLNCVDICPVADTLSCNSLITRRKLSPKTVAIGVVAVFIVITGLGMISGNWKNNVSIDEYRHHQKYLKSYGHPTGTKDIDAYNRRVDADKQNEEKYTGEGTP